MDRLVVPLTRKHFHPLGGSYKSNSWTNFGLYDNPALVAVTVYRAGSGLSQ